MPEIKSILAQVGTNQFTEGYYTLNDGLLSMVMADGSPAGITHRMRPEDDERAIAVVLTRKIRAQLKGEIVPGFSRQLEYPIA